MTTAPAARLSANAYRRAREGFVAACSRRGLTVATYPHPAVGPDGRAIYTDAVRIGPADARRVLVLVSGNHGVEGYAGSGAQVAFLDEVDPADLAPDAAVLLIHMLNPWGAAWRRRHNEDNIDLNRHFVDRSGPLPDNSAYAELVRHGLWDSLLAANPSDALASVRAFRHERGETAHAQAVFQGQYEDAGGLGYGGAVPSWSDRTLTAILDEMLDAPEAAALIDLHTGLGPFGVGTAICTEPPGSSETPLLRRWYPDHFVALLEDQQGLPYRLQGDLANALKRDLPDARILAVSLEFGTFEAARFAELMVKDAWACRQADPSHPEVEAIRCDLAHFFYPDSQAWRDMVRARSLSVIGAALEGLREL